MKAKLLIVLMIILSISMFAKRQNIRMSQVKIGSAHPRSVVVLPEVSYEGSNVFLTVHDDSDVIHLRISDAKTGQIVYIENLTIITNETIPLFTDLENGEYRIELTIGDNTYAGYFDINETDTF